MRFLKGAAEIFLRVEAERKRGVRQRTSPRAGPTHDLRQPPLPHIVGRRKADMPAKHPNKVEFGIARKPRERFHVQLLA